MSFWKPGTKGPDAIQDRSSEREGGNVIIYNPKNKMSLTSQRRGLPIYQYRLNILYAVETYS